MKYTFVVRKEDGILTYKVMPVKKADWGHGYNETDDKGNSWGWYHIFRNLQREDSEVFDNVEDAQAYCNILNTANA